MFPTVADLWLDCDSLTIDEGVTVVVAEWNARVVVDGVCGGGRHSPRVGNRFG